MKNIALLLLCILSDCICFSQISGVYKDTTAVNFFKRTKGWIASDGALTVALKDGGSLWLMGDSHINDYDTITNTIPCLFQVRNAALLQPKNNWDWHHTKTLVDEGKRNKTYIKNYQDSNWFCWPGAGIQSGDTVYVTCGSLRNTGTGGAFGFEAAGADYWAKIKYPEMNVVGYTPMQGQNNVNYGAGVIEEGDYIYMFGAKGNMPSNLLVARFLKNDFSSAWQFWDGKSWSADSARAATIAVPAGVSLSVSKLNNKYVLITSALSVGCDMGKDIYISVSDHITGPFTKSKIVYSINDTLQGHYPFFYTSVLHPEIINSKNEVLLTYCINGYGTCVEDCIKGRANPDIYRPRGIRVPVKEIMQLH